jgi:hypothetical protein
VALLFLGGCSSVAPAVSTVCSVCSTVCPLVNLEHRACPEGQKARVVNWKAIEERGEQPQIECRK